LEGRRSDRALFYQVGSQRVKLKISRGLSGDNLIKELRASEL
jgi:hypothetical protein